MVLRKLALKSILNFGKLYDYTVSQVLTLNKHRYLIWVYYNCSHIDFLDEILDILDITEERRIKKPGKDVFYYEEHRREFMPVFDKMQTKLILRNTNFYKKRKKLIAFDNENKQISALTNRNKGQKRYNYNERPL